MGNLNVALTLSLRDQLIGPLQRALADAEKTVSGFEKSIGKVGATGEQSAQKLTNLTSKVDGLGKIQGAEQLRSSLAGIGNAADEAHRKTSRLASAMEKLSSLKPMVVPAIASLVAAKNIVDIPVTAFANLEEANTALRVTMMKKGGKVSANYHAIQKNAIALGNQLPGTTRDFVGSANELLSLGVTEQAVVGGGLTAAAHLGVVMKMPQMQAARTVAKLREAYNLKDDELPGMADEIQRNRFAFGIQPDDLLQAAKYSAPTLGTLGLNGKQNMSEIMTLQGMANKKGMDGSQFGTNFDMMLQRLAKGPLMLEEAKKGMKAEARNSMEKLGIKFDFYDKNGKLKTEDGSAAKGMIRELEKLEIIRAKLGDKAAMEVSGALFGQEAARPANILAQYGVKGYEEARAQVAAQASLDERIIESLTTLNSKIEATSGSFENLMASMGKQIGEAQKSKYDKANALLGSATGFFNENPMLGTAGVLGGAAVASYAAWKATGFGLSLLKPAAAAAVPAATGVASQAVTAGGAAAAGGSVRRQRAGHVGWCC
jgi:TP901 family phage tail tape measure protein